MAIGDAPKPSVIENKTEISSVRNIMEKYNVIFVHGIHPTFIPGPNSVLKKGTPWEVKLKILVALEPAISTSTIKQGDYSRNLWSNIGVVLAGGKVVSASHSDANTVVTKVEGSRGKNLSDDQIETAIEESIGQRSQHKYNELVVEEPRPVALYWSLDFESDNRHGVKYEHLQKMAQELGLPLFVLKSGRLIDWEREKVNGVYPTIDQGQLLNLPGISSEQRSKILQELAGTDSPFRPEKVVS